MAKLSYSIIGTGALGGFYGARLHHAGATVRFLARSDYAHIRDHGLVVESCDGDFSIADPEVYNDPAAMPASDIVLVALKTTQNGNLPELLRAAVKDDAAILMMQNGLGIEADAYAIKPGHRVVGGLAFLCSNKLGPGHIHHIDYGAVRLGEFRADGAPAGITDLVAALASEFESAQLHVDLEEDLSVARWKKLVWNVTYNGLCVARDCTTDVLNGGTESRALCRRIMEEVLAIAAGNGHHISPGFVDHMLDYTDDMAAYKPSMLLDYRDGRPLELEAIYRRPIAAADQAGVDCPEIRALYAKLAELDPAAQRA